MLVNNDYFREVAIKGIPKMIPNSLEYVEWWKEQIRRIRNGYWVGGKYMPGRLYWHVNFFNIERNINNSKRKMQGLPDLRDIEWEIFSIIDKCKGFSGFDENKNPLFEGDVKGFLMIGPRDYGKSVIAGSNAAYEYNFFRDNEIVVSAYDKKYIFPTMGKIKYALDRVPGGVEFMGEFFPSPLHHKRIRDAWDEEIRSGYKDNLTGKTLGYNSRILVRSYMDNHTASNGLRPSFHIFEEIGMFNNLLQSYESSVPCWLNSGVQFGVPFLIGTGGDMQKGSVSVRRMFYQPEVHNLMSFIDEHDNSSSKTCYFLPAWKGINRFKDTEGNTNKEKALAELMDRREKKKSDKTAYEQELQYYPITPKEAFLVTTGNIFPRSQIEDQIEFLLKNKKTEFIGQKGKLEWSGSDIKWIPDESIFEVDFPHDMNSKSEGCIVIYEHPQVSEEHGTIPSLLYIGGCDPYNQDQTENSYSLGSIFIYKRFWTVHRTYNIIVAEYTGRPATSNDYYENVRKLLTYYNAKCLYENDVKGMKAYFETKRSLYMLAEQPSIIKDIIPNSKVSRGYGIHMVTQIKNHGLDLIRNYLMEGIDTEESNIKKIPSINLLKELLYYNDTGNFDRVMALAVTLLYNEELHKVVVQKNIDTERSFTFESTFNKFGVNIKRTELSPDSLPADYKPTDLHNLFKNYR